MKRSGTTVWLNTPVDTLLKRLKKERSQRPLLKELTDDQLHSFILKKFADRRMYYEQADITVEEDNLELEKLIAKIFHA